MHSALDNVTTVVVNMCVLVDVHVLFLLTCTMVDRGLNMHVCVVYVDYICVVFF